MTSILYDKSEAVEGWPPRSPDITISTSIELCEAKPFAFTINGQVYRSRDGRRAVKNGGSEREFYLMKKAGSCSVKPIGRVMMEDPVTGRVTTTGIMMDLEKPFNCSTISPDQRPTLAKEMIHLVHRLHQTYRIVHGDIKPENMLLTLSDNRLVLCDFAESRTLDDDPGLWDGATTINYLAPNRDDNAAPTIIDDLYALGLSIWQLYSGTMPFANLDQDEISELLQQKKTVDLDIITDAEIRNIVTDYLGMGGAEV